MTFLFFENSYSLITVLSVGIISFGLGLLFKSAILRKQRKRILKLEDEMLANHARILGLEKIVAETRKEKNGVQHDFDMSSRKTDFEAKVS